METVVEEYNASRIVVYTINADGCITCGVSKEINVLIGVGEQAACPNVIACKQCANSNKN